MEFIKGELLIRNNATREVRRCEFDIPKEADDYSYKLLWQEGNFSCDCNRRLFFEQSIEGREGSDDENIVCGDGGFSVTITGPNGTVLYSDMDSQLTTTHPMRYNTHQ